MSFLEKNAAIVLVHGARADGSCWQNVILPLRKEGIGVTCAPIPLTSLTEDLAALQRVLERASGPAVLDAQAKSGLDSVDLGPLKANQGDQNYNLPGGADRDKYDAGLIYAERPHALFGLAKLEPF